MNILVDTSVWSIAFRRKSRSPMEEVAVRELDDLVLDGRAAIIGPIRQELLSGISKHNQYVGLRDELRAFEDIELTQAHYETAAEMSNECRRHGVQGSPIDFLICAAARHADIPVFTLDGDFERYKHHAHIKLHMVREKQG